MKYLLLTCLLALPFFIKAQLPSSYVKPIDALSTKDSILWFDSNFGLILKEKQIVGLGEVCHGGHEPFEIKARIMRYLILKQGYRQLLFETADIGLRDLNSYLSDETLDKSSQIVDSLFAKRDKILGGPSPFDAREVKSVFTWIKEFNLTHPNDKVTVRGIDISGITYNYVKIKYFSKTDLKKIQQKSGTGIVTIPKATQIVDDWYNQSKDSLKKVYTSEQMQNLQLDLRDFHNLVRYQLGGGEKSSVLMTLRDSVMAQNLIDLLHGKAIIWAHDTHVANSGFGSGLFHAKMLGNYLREKFGASYFIVLTDFSGRAEVTVKSTDGSFNVEEFSSNRKSTAYLLFNKYNLKKGFVFTRDLQDLNTGFGYNSIGAAGARNFILCSQAGFDALFFVEHISPSHLTNNN